MTSSEEGRQLRKTGDGRGIILSSEEQWEVED